MSHSVAQSITNQISLPNASTVLVAQAQPSGRASTGIAGDKAASLASGNANAANSTTTVVDRGSVGWAGSEYIGHIVLIQSGALAGQTRLITSNTNRALTVDIAFSVEPDGMDFLIMSPSTSLPVVQGWSIDQVTAVASQIRLTSKGLVAGTMTTKVLLIAINTAAAAFATMQTGGRFLGVPGGDLRVTTVGAIASGTLTPDAYWINDSVYGVIDQ